MKNLKMYVDIAKRLELSAQDQHRMTMAIFNYIEQFTSQIDKCKAFYGIKPLSSNFFDINTFTKSSSIEDIISFLDNVLDKNGVNAASAGYLAYIPGGGLYPTALADYIAAATNRYSTYYDASPPAVELENLVVKWLCNLIGYPQTAGGYLTSGGSSANLIALHTARNHHKLRGVDFARTIVYLTEHTHHSINKSLDLIGLHEAILKIIPVDKNFHMDIECLETEIKKNIQENLRPWIIIAGLGTTNLGSVDPIDELSKISEKYNLWLHIDGAYGGFFLLTERGKKLFKSIEKADSVILDPHKTLFLSYGSGAVVVKNREHLLDTYLFDAAYMHNSTNSEQEKASPCNVSFELSRNFRALRIWLPIKIFGIEPFQAALEEKLLLAEYFYHKIQTIRGIEVACKPDLSIVVFRYVPRNKDAEKFNLDLIENIRADGRVILSGTFINKKTFIRMACVCYRTHLEHIDLALQIIKENIKLLNEYTHRK